MSSLARSILVVGGINMDLVNRVKRLPAAGETIFSLGFDTVPGGKGANQAVAAARLGYPTTILGCIGADENGRRLRESLKAHGVDVSGLRVVKRASTGTATITVDRTGQNTIVVAPGANLQLRTQQLDKKKELFAQADAMLIQLELRLETIEAALRLAAMTDTLSILDAGPAMDLPPEILKLASIVSPNESETKAMTGIEPDTGESAIAAAEKLRKLGAQRVVLKLGARGALYLDDNHLAFMEPFAVEAVDATAAGDAFTAGLAAAWNPENPESALRFANACGAAAASRPGAQPSLPKMHEVQRVLAGKPPHNESYISALEGDEEESDMWIHDDEDLAGDDEDVTLA